MNKKTLLFFLLLALLTPFAAVAQIRIFKNRKTHNKKNPATKKVAGKFFSYM